MSDIPADVMKAAREAVAQTEDTAPIGGSGLTAQQVRDGKWDGTRHLDAVCRAILAERQRCANVALSVKGSANAAHGEIAMKWGRLNADIIVPILGDYSGGIADAIAEAIMKGDQP